MSLEIKGTVKAILPKVTGEGRNGTWEKQEFVIETGGQYPNSVCFSIWGDRAEALEKVKIGDSVTVGFDVESREYQGRWFTNAKAWKVVKEGSTAPPKASTQQGDQPTDPQGDDIPF